MDAADSAWAIPENAKWVQEGRVKTVGDAKDLFYRSYGGPLRELATSFVTGLLSQITLVQIKEGFTYSRLFAFGLESLCTNFLQDLEEDKRDAVRNSLYIALDLDPAKVKSDAAALQSMAEGKTEDELLSSDEFQKIASQELTPAKYTTALAAGLFTLMPMVGEEVSDSTIERWCSKLNLKPQTFKRDWAEYKKSQERQEEGRAVLAELQAGAKRREAEKLKEEADKAAKAVEDEEAKMVEAEAEKLKKQAAEKAAEAKKLQEEAAKAAAEAEAAESK